MFFLCLIGRKSAFHGTGAWTTSLSFNQEMLKCGSDGWKGPGPIPNELQGITPSDKWTLHQGLSATWLYRLLTHTITGISQNSLFLRDTLKSSCVQKKEKERKKEIFLLSLSNLLNCIKRHGKIQENEAQRRRKSQSKDC